jgi:hypothetical protein
MATANRPFGRIRLFEDQADYLNTILKLERDRVTLQRRMHKKEAEGTHPFNRQIHFIDQMLDEVERTREEMGWKSTNGQDEILGSS